MCRKPCISFKVLTRMFGAKFAHETNMTEWIMRKPDSFDFGSWIGPYHQCQPSTSFNFYKKLIKKHQIESLLEHIFAWTWILPAAFGTYQLDPRCPRLKQNRTKKRIACKSAKMNAMNLISIKFYSFARSLNGSNRSTLACHLCCYDHKLSIRIQCIKLKERLWRIAGPVHCFEQIAYFTHCMQHNKILHVQFSWSIETSSCAIN